jgi:hypothetical protein
MAATRMAGRHNDGRTARRDSRRAAPERACPQLHGMTVDSWITRLTRAADAPNVRHPHRNTTRVTRPARGTGRPGREPDEPRKTEARNGVNERRRRERSPDGPRRHDRRRSAWTVCGNRSRRASMAFHLSPRHITAPSTMAWIASG